MADTSWRGSKIGGLRRRENVPQVDLARQLGISPSYLNLIEHNRRALSAPLLIKLAQVFHLDLQALSADNDARLSADLLEAFGDPLFEGHDLAATEVRELAAQAPSLARATLALYRAYRTAQESVAGLAMKLSEGDDGGGIDHSRLPNEEVGDLIQRHGNYFAA